MIVDARWREKARAAVMHIEQDGARFLWMGFDPDALVEKDDRQMLLLIRTAFRWAAGQPVSEGAVGGATTAQTLTPESRRDARAARFVFGVDRLANPRLFLLHMANRGPKPIDNPSVMIWLPPKASDAAVAGDLFMRRNVSLTAMQGERAWVVSLPRLSPNEDRIIKLKVETARR
jgi:hypothetical protein